MRSEPGLIAFFSQRSTSEFQSAADKFAPDKEAKQTEKILILAAIRQDGAKDERCSVPPLTPTTSLN